MKKIMAWVNQIKNPRSDNLEKLMNVELLEKAASSIVKMILLKSFGEETKVLNANSEGRVEVNKSSTLFDLDSFLDSNGLLQVNGRLWKPRLSHNETHLVVLSKQSNITEAII